MLSLPLQWGCYYPAGKGRGVSYIPFKVLRITVFCHFVCSSLGTLQQSSCFLFWFPMCQCYLTSSGDSLSWSVVCVGLIFSYWNLSIVCVHGLVNLLLSPAILSWLSIKKKPYTEHWSIPSPRIKRNNSSMSCSWSLLLLVRGKSEESCWLSVKMLLW